MSSLSKLNKAKNKANQAQRIANEWERRFKDMRKQRDHLKNEIDTLVKIHTEKLSQFKYLSAELKNCREKTSKLERANNA